MWHSWLINLEQDTARLGNSRRLFDGAGLAFSRIEAIDGRVLAEKRVREVYDARAARRRFKYPLVRAEIGCYLSHIEAWRKIADSGEPGGFVFEDDFAFDGDPVPVMDALSHDDGEWNMVKLFSIKTRPRVLAQRPLTQTHRLTIPYAVPNGLVGYGLRREAAARLVEQSIPFFRPVDEDHKFFWEKGLRIALVQPMPVVMGDDRSATGTVGDHRSAGRRKTHSGALHQAITNMAYQLSYRGQLWYHRRAGRSDQVL